MSSRGISDFDTVTPGMTDLCEVSDLAISKLSTFPGCDKVCKQAGFPECCAERNFAQIEFEYIAASVDPMTLREMARRFLRQQKRAGYCPFLGDNGECEVYDVRPVECRTIATVDYAPATGCAVGQPEPASPKRRLARSLYRLLAVIAGQGPRRPMSEWLLAWNMERNVEGQARRTP